MYLSDLVSSLLSIAAPSEPLAMSVSPPDDAELESSRVADDAARASIFTSEKFWPIFLNHLKKTRATRYSVVVVGWPATHRSRHTPLKTDATRMTACRWQL